MRANHCNENSDGGNIFMVASPEKSHAEGRYCATDKRADRYANWRGGAAGQSGQGATRETAANAGTCGREFLAGAGKFIV
ncbi:hypothetical protein [Duganella sp. CF517]|uniref:hypothetical protein n=1 Tax=Duganella sp. CF517 TaxID=1881038 RepID=UPI00116086A6|nr:hypothetical protein [Duganella sp. CF517]